jgi:hypothetical protein
MVSILLSKTVDLKLDTFGLNLIFNCLSPSYKNASSKSAYNGIPLLLKMRLECNPKEL